MRSNQIVVNDCKQSAVFANPLHPTPKALSSDADLDQHAVTHVWLLHTFVTQLKCVKLAACAKNVSLEVNSLSVSCTIK